MQGDGESEVRYAVGLDLGDGESSLCRLPTHGRGKAEIYARGTEGTAIVTALGREPLKQDGHRYVIGEAAVLAKNALHFSVNFKTRPDPEGLVVPEAVQFAQVLLTEFFAAHPEVREDCAVYVGHPTGWDAASVAAYREHFASMRLPVHLVAESQSALVHVRDRRAGRRDPRGLDRVLVVDIGSSTTDFTFVADLVPRNLPVGSDLGCALIDNELVERVRAAFQANEQFTAALDKDGAPEMLRLVCRPGQGGAVRRGRRTPPGSPGRLRPPVHAVPGPRHRLAQTAEHPRARGARPGRLGGAVRGCPGGGARAARRGRARAGGTHRGRFPHARGAPAVSRRVPRSHRRERHRPLAVGDPGARQRRTPPGQRGPVPA
ncbi:hypothetical protein [Streptomyces africanus]|uniref:hypothetical protein n=1 Tax=Streptomyces africanus TaxID=231024 RepID=UPI0027D8C0B2|nr:hypothetical protein [Streptomyces africanus]